MKPSAILTAEERRRRQDAVDYAIEQGALLGNTIDPHLRFELQRFVNGEIGPDDLMQIVMALPQRW